MRKALTLSIVIPVCNEEYHLKRCLDAVSRQSSQPDEIIVVDNNSTDQTAAIAVQFQGVRVVSEKTQGVLYASRKGFDEAKGDIICRIDADTIMEANWVEQIRNYFTENPYTAAVTGNCYFYDFPFKRFIRVLHHAIYYSLQKAISGTEILWGSNMAITADAWKTVRADCISHPGIHEDIDLSIHLQDRHLLIKRSPSLVVGVSLMRGKLTPLKLIRYIWPWPSNSLASYFWSWPRTYWINKRYLQATLNAAVMLISGLIMLPITTLTYPLSLFKKQADSE